MQLKNYLFDKKKKLVCEISVRRIKIAKLKYLQEKKRVRANKRAVKKS